MNMILLDWVQSLHYYSAKHQNKNDWRLRYAGFKKDSSGNIVPRILGHTSELGTILEIVKSGVANGDAFDKLSENAQETVINILK